MKRAASFAGNCLVALALLACLNFCSAPPAKRPEPALQPPAPAPTQPSVEEVKVRREIEGYLGQLFYAYRRALKNTPGLEGRMKVSFTISQAGRAADVSLVESTLPAELTQEMTTRMRHWIFDVKPAKPFTVTYPFLFLPSK